MIIIAPSEIFFIVSFAVCMWGLRHAACDIKETKIIFLLNVFLMSLNESLVKS
jgi:hypothetical protein